MRFSIFPHGASKAIYFGNSEGGRYYLSTGVPARLVVTKRELFIQRNTAKMYPFLGYTLGGWQRQ